MEKKQIARRIAKFNIKHPIIKTKEEWGPYASVPMYRWMHKQKYGKIVWTTYKKWFGNIKMSCDISFDYWAPLVTPPKCLWGMIIELDEFVGLIRMYEIRLDVPDLRALKDDANNVFGSTKLIWKKQDFEAYIDIRTNEIYDKNGNRIRKSDRVFSSVTLDRVNGEHSNITAIHRKLTTFKDMQQFYVNDLEYIKSQLYNLGYDTGNMKMYRRGRQMENLVEYLSKKPKNYGDTRTYIEKRNAFCASWGEYRRYSEGNHIVKIPEQYNGKNVYQISFNHKWYRTPIVYIIGKDYCIYASTNCNDKLRISDLSNHHFVNKYELSVFSGNPEIGWVANMEGDENGHVDVENLLRNISNVFYEQLTKMGLIGLRMADQILHGGARRTGNVLKYYGISKKQAIALNDCFIQYSWLDKNRINNVFNAIRGFFSFSETISDEKNFDEVFKQMCQCDRGNLSFGEQGYLFRINEDITTIPPVERKIIMDQKKKILRFCAESRSPLYDTVRMYMRYMHYIETGEDNYYSWENHIPKAFWFEVATNIHSAADFSRTHDLYMERCRGIDQRTQAQKDADLQRKLAKYEEENKKRKEKWEFANKKFAVVFPMTVSEVRLEGGALHHCVGGYAQRHIQNETTILFLRKEELPDTSFYTIEIQKNGTEWKVVQVHGACNKWVGNDPEAAVFLYRYFKAHNVSCNDDILLSTASGYCGGNAKKLDPSILTDED